MMRRYAQHFAEFSSLTLRRSLSSSLRFNTGDKNYYRILKITPNATQDEVKKAYYKLSKLYHPDTNQSEEAHDVFTAINEAYNVLGNLAERKNYDRGLVVKYRPSMGNKQATKSHHFEGKRIVYDFDDWTQKYYEEAMKRRKRHFEKKRQFDRRHVSDEMEVFNRNIILAAVFTLIGVVVMVSGKKI